ncbi:MAG: mechanosensitive ion channel protein MscS [Denitrovibrio sp.]|nr:MAG: mechanosensitive ion channel protein MscS [Denitrovibrio sp.]
MENTVNYIQNWLAEFGPNIVYALIILFLGRYSAKVISKVVVKALSKANAGDTLIKFLKVIIYYTLLAAVIIAALNQLGIQTTSIVAVLATAGLAVGLALKDSLSNFAAGVMIIVFKPFVIGNFVETAGTMGTVEEISIFTVKMKTPDNKSIIVPNSSVINGNITNYSAKDTRRVDIAIGVGYESDIKKTKEVLANVVAETDTIMPDPEPVIVLTALGNSSIDFAIRSWVKTDDYWPTYFAMLENVKTKLDEAGINIPYPQMDVHIKKED